MGAAPCAMVYNALMTAMLTGAPATGALFMTGFGLATVPAVALTALGTAQIVAMGPLLPKATLRKGVGIAIKLLGFASTAVPAASLAALCMN
nr:sulfite exporter TauE/SafE family protein [Rhizobium rhizogenes]